MGEQTQGAEWPTPLPKIKAKYRGCWNLKQKQKMLETLSSSDSISGERIEPMFQV